MSLKSPGECTGGTATSFLSGDKERGGVLDEDARLPLPAH